VICSEATASQKRHQAIRFPEGAILSDAAPLWRRNSWSRRKGIELSYAPWEVTYDAARRCGKTIAMAASGTFRTSCDVRLESGIRPQSGRPPTRRNLWVHALKQLRPRPHSFALHPFCTRIFCPTGKSVKTCPAPLRKIFRFRRRANQRYQLAPSFPGKRGGRASSRTWEGMRWTRWRRRACVRRAVFRERVTARRTNGAKAYGKTVWS
jgi:hypothetical protein